ncbi:MAG TPA: hypothetical protein VG347_02125 [Verrucomicrobiae bacterium]|nr:hypothetical protein [Verrucomicrobiae bacterium]
MPPTTPDGKFPRVQPAATSRSRPDALFALMVAYLAVPSLIFLLTWVRPLIGIPAALIVLAAFCRLMLQVKAAASRPPLSRNLLFAIIALAGVWTLIIGVGGIFPQSNDYLKHNLLFHDLTTMQWPVKYQSSDHGGYLCYGLGYYLVPTAIGKLLGLAALPFATFLWTFAGLVLFFYWIATLTPSPGKTLAAVLLFSTTAIVWSLFKKYGLPGHISPDTLETALLKNGLYFNYSDSFTRFDYQPQHALAAWLCAAVFLERLWRQRDPRGLVFVWSACLLWSPLTCLGLLIIPLATLGRVRWQNYFEPINLIGGGVLVAILGIYFQGHMALSESGFIWKFSNGADWLGYYALFLILTLSPLLFLALAEQKYRLLGEGRPLFFIAIVTLIVLPLYKLGFAGDLRMQASAPALLLLALAADRILRNGSLSLKRPLWLFLLGSLALGAIFPLTRPWTCLLSKRSDFSYDTIVRTTGSQNLSEIHDDKFDLAAQYLGRNNAPAARYLLR